MTRQPPAACGRFFDCRCFAGPLAGSFCFRTPLTYRYSTLLLRALLLAFACAGASWAQTNPAATVEVSPRFDIFEFVVSGDTLLGSAAIERAVYEFMGPGRGVAEVEAARKALEKAYQDAGFLSVSVLIPPQRVDQSGGEVRLQVVQATVEKLRVTGAEFFLPSQIREGVPSLAPGNVPNFNEMQQQLSDLGRASADREITPILAAGETPGTMAVELKVKDELPLHGSLEVNNKQSVNTKVGRLEAGLSYDNLFQRGHALGLNWFVAPTRTADANIVTLSYQLPWGGLGDKLSLGLTHSDSNTPTPVGGATASRGDTWRLRWRDELPAREDISQGLSWGATLRNLRDRNIEAAGTSSDATPLRYTTLNASYDLAMLDAATPGRQSRLQADLIVSMPGLNARDVNCADGIKNQFACKRQNASARFQTLNLTLSHAEPFNSAWGRWSLSARLQAQAADTALVSSEQVAYGGQDSVRGYYEGEQLGDLGAALRLELTAPAWPMSERVSLRGLGFFDGAFVRRLYATSTEVRTQKLGSWGFALRLETAFGLQATLDLARVMFNSTRLDGTTLQQVPTSGPAASRGTRVDLSLRQSF
jgi:hemolysin activation/secretion protein